MPRSDALVSVEAMIDSVLLDPAASHWLKAALASLRRRDPVDASADARVLHQLIDARCAALVVDVCNADDEPTLPFPVGV